MSADRINGSADPIRPTGPRVRFDKGDTSNPLSYSLICGCGAYLNVLGVLRANEAGQRSCYCPKCKHATCVDARGQIISYSPYDLAKKTIPLSS